MKHLSHWLPLVFGCHQRPERSFHVRGTPLPICARCSGLLLGLILGATGFHLVQPSPGFLPLLLAPLLVDGFVQLQTTYESRNWLRGVTGILFGYGLLSGFLQSILVVYQWGSDYAKKMM